MWWPGVSLTAATLQLLLIYHWQNIGLPVTTPKSTGPQPPSCSTNPQGVSLHLSLPTRNLVFHFPTTSSGTPISTNPTGATVFFYYLYSRRQATSAPSSFPTTSSSGTPSYTAVTPKSRYLRAILPSKEPSSSNTYHNGGKLNYTKRPLSPRHLDFTFQTIQVFLRHAHILKFKNE